MEEYLGFVFLAIILGVITGIIGEWIAKRKGRRKREGFWLGFLLSFIGLIIECVLPKITTPDPVRRSAWIESRILDAIESDGRSRRKCPFCAEMILAEARVCRYCQRDVPLEEAVQGSGSNVLDQNEPTTTNHRQDGPEISIKPTQSIELSEIPPGADPSSSCNPPAAPVHEAGAQAPTNEQQSPAKEHSFLLTSSSGELNAKQTEKVEQAPTRLTCPSCAKVISPNDAFCFFCGKKLRP